MFSFITIVNVLIQREINKRDEKNGSNRIYRYLKDNEFDEKEINQVLKELENEKNSGGSIDYADEKKDGNNASLEVKLLKIKQIYKNGHKVLSHFLDMQN
jgi:hypothetical protein